VIRVRDNDPGIADADRSAIFERFVRAHAHMDAVLGVTGSGLGLAIAADYIRAMGGSIDCESVVGEGSWFYIMLRLNIPRDNEADSPQASS
jgi:signal transduction histidine kinase